MSAFGDSILARIEYDTNGFGCWLWTGAQTTGGYGSIWCRPKARQAHRVSFEAFNGPIPNGLHVLHRCDVRACVNPDHLFAGTNAENAEDRDKKGRGRPPLGESNHGAKLTNDQVLKLRELYAGGASRRELQQLFGISRATVLNVATRQSWRHLGGPTEKRGRGCREYVSKTVGQIERLP